MLPTNSLVAIGYTSVAVTQREQGSWDQSIKVSGTTPNAARQHTSLCAYGFGMDHQHRARKDKRIVSKRHDARAGRAVPSAPPYVDTTARREALAPLTALESQAC